MHLEFDVNDIRICELRTQLGIAQSEFAARYSIPFRTDQSREAEVREPPEYILKLLEAFFEPVCDSLNAFFVQEKELPLRETTPVDSGVFAKRRLSRCL